MSNQEFLTFVSEIRANVLHVDTLASPFTAQDSDEVLRAIANIGSLLSSEIERSFPDKNMDDDSLAAYVELESVLLRLRGQETLRLEALRKFEQLTQTGALAQ